MSESNCKCCGGLSNCKCCGGLLLIHEEESGLCQFCTECECEIEEQSRDMLDAAMGIANALRIVSHIALWAIALYLLSGCSTVRPLTEYQHISHATDGLSGPGYDMLSMGIRWRPVEGVTVDLLEGVNKQKMHGFDEVFTGRVTVEF